MLLTPTTAADASSVAYVRSTADLAVFFEEHVGAVSLHRHVPPTLAAYADRLAVSLPFAFKAVVAIEQDNGLDALDELAVQLPPDDARDVLLLDIAYWIEVVTCMSGLPRCGVRLARLSERMCPSFHVDRIPFRLVCTYAGPGTEWVDERDVDRRHPVASSVRDGATIHRATGMDVTLLKGTDWNGRGVVHRSPVSSRPRILLTVEPVG